MHLPRPAAPLALLAVLGACALSGCGSGEEEGGSAPASASPIAAVVGAFAAYDDEIEATRQREHEEGQQEREESPEGEEAPEGEESPEADEPLEGK